MPQLGYGVYQVEPDECERCVLDALSVGYRMIETAQAYLNEEAVGNAWKKSGVNRDEIFIVSKVWPSNYGDGQTMKSIGLDLHTNGWFVNLNANYYDRIYLSYSPSYRYEKVLKNRQSAHQTYPEIFPSVVTEDGNSWLPEAVAQAKGHGGWMVSLPRV